MVSNHGGRQLDSAPAPLDMLPLIVDAVGHKMELLIDSGFRRGSDLFKALALGARAVGIGRPYIWGLGSFGEAGVDRVLEILQAELRITMAGCGAKSIKEITPAHITQQHA